MYWRLVTKSTSVIFLIIACLPVDQPIAKFDRILFLGNSLTIHEPLPDEGWNYHHGFAASAPDRDYPHRLQLGIAARQGSIPEIGIILMDIPPELYPDDIAQQIAAFDPDLIIVQMGDDVLPGQLVNYGVYQAEYQELAEAARATNARVIAVGMWYPTGAEDIREIDLRRAVDEAGIVFVPIGDLKSPETTAELDPWCTNHNICWHPGDRGHAAIAQRILAAIYSQATYLPLVHGGGGTVPPVSK